jgi:adenosylhomocysteinase
VGESIVFSAESILRSSGQLLRGRNSLVIGYGKIGQSIALDLCRRGVRVAVCDSDPLRLSLAASHGYSVVHPANKQAAFAGADCIFCATGNHSIIADEWSGIKNGAFVFAATSADDEFEMSGLSEYSSTQLVTHVTTLRCQNRHFHLAVDGNAVNFVHGAEVRPFIYLVQGAMIESIASLVRGRALSPGMQELPIEAERKVARYFMAEHYGHPPQHSRKDFRSTAPPAPVRIKFRLRSRTMSVIEE